MDDKIKKILGWIKEYLSWVIAVGGLCVSVYGILGHSKFNDKVVYLMIIIDSLILLGLGIYYAISYFKNINLKEENKIIRLEKDTLIKDINQNVEKYRKAFLLFSANDNYNIKTLHKFLSRLYTLTDEVLDATDSIKQEEEEMRKHSYTEREIEKKIVALTIEKNKKFSEIMYDDYKRFLSNILSRTQANIEAYLRVRGYECEVSVTVKQFVEPCELNSDKKYITEPYVYTAFRDSRTWGNKRRNEVAERLYTVEKNSDFIHCISKGYYIFNNKNGESRDYCNENEQFDKFYNCGVTTLISSKGEKQTKIVYGFLACDILNLKYENKDIMDQTVAEILDTSSYIIAAYFDNIDFNWYLCQVSVEFKSFWEMVYKNYLVAI